MQNEYDFQKQLEFSQGIVQRTAEETIKTMLCGCVSVSKANIILDKSGIDYIATLRGGATVGIDHKARAAGCKKHWRQGPELALEKWSVVPSENCPTGKPGWTLDESKATDYTLHTFAIEDTFVAYLLPFQLLRVAFRRRINQWWKSFRHELQISTRQGSGGWRSECIFVPAFEVLEGIKEEMIYV